MTRRLVLTADDAGYSPGTNEAIVDLAARGRITATTVLTPAPDADGFVALLTAARAGVGSGDHDSDKGGTGLADLAVGVHATLTSEATLPPFAPLSGAATLTDLDGHLPLDPESVVAQASDDDVATELEVQINWLLGRGITPVRLDSHSGTLYGLTGRPFIAQALEVCARYELGFRLPRELTGPLALALAAGGPQLATLHATAVSAADDLGVRLPQVMLTQPLPVAAIGSYEALRDSYIAMLADIPSGTSELFLHPAPAEPALMAATDEWLKRTWELRLLDDPLWLDALQRERIELVPAW